MTTESAPIGVMPGSLRAEPTCPAPDRSRIRTPHYSRFVNVAGREKMAAVSEPWNLYSTASGSAN